MNYKVFLDRKAEKQLDTTPEPNRSRIREKLLFLKNSGFSPELDIRKLKGYRNYYRIRVGSYRILFELREGFVIVVFAILPRDKAYS
jgi:mRNA interferase RelE/StbE